MLYFKLKINLFLLVIGLILICLSAMSFELPFEKYETQNVGNAERFDQLIIKLKPNETEGGMFIAGTSSKLSFNQMQNLVSRSGVDLINKGAMSGGAQILDLPYKMNLDEVANVIANLEDDPDVEYVEPNRRHYPMLEPNDTHYFNGNQWHYKDSSGEPGSVNLPDAWADTTGDESLVIAVLDSGLLPDHEDISSDRIVSGYDFITHYRIANDDIGYSTNSRDNDPTDPGDWITLSEAIGVDASGDYAGCDVQDSSWHGTHVAGTIGADTNNNMGVAGVNWNSKILPVRVLGKCGGTTQDIADGIRWAAGIHVDGVPDNANPAKVINLSLGGKHACSSSPVMQSAINDAVNIKGAVVVVAAGNEGIDAKNYSPAGCDNVITVASINRDGGRSTFSNYGSSVEIAAPGGDEPSNVDDDIYSTLNDGTTEASGDSYAYYQGTSMATPHVAGIISLLLSIRPGLSPDQVNKKIQATARAFPTGSDCNVSLCGAGIIDATELITEIYDPVAWIDTADNTYTGDTIILSGAGSFDLDGGFIKDYFWQQTSGNPVNLTGVTSDTASFTAPSEPETLIFQLDVTDDTNNTSSISMSVSISNPPASSSGGGGSGGGGGGCFIATAAYGTAMEPDVRYLRAFRDEYLLTNKPGQIFVDFYYDYSPPVADTLREYSLLRTLVRGSLKPLVWLSEAVVSDEILALQTVDAP
ncbi:MAG: S8 family peptidase [Proteobacteria bacterium]|nr:S8 family peptidase [Pseudomonadota bacterium]